MNQPQATRREALRLVSVSKVYGEQQPVPALRNVSLALAPGSFTSIMGPSGSGKSTLLQCAAGLDRPTSGQVFVAGQPMPEGDETGLTEFRRDRIGFVFQQYNLVSYLTVEQNVVLPARFAGRRVDRRATRDVLQYRTAPQPVGVVEPSCWSRCRAVRFGSSWSGYPPVCTLCSAR